jgi:hypothetical protein
MVVFAIVAASNHSTAKSYQCVLWKKAAMNNL